MLTNVTMNVAEIFLETDTYWRQTHDGQNWPPRSFIYVREVTTFSLRCVLLAKVAQWRWWWGHHYTTLHMHTCGFVWKFPAFISAFEVTRGHLQPTTRLEAVTWGFSMTICFLVLLWVLRRPIPASYTRALQHFGLLFDATPCGAQGREKPHRCSQNPSTSGQQNGQTNNQNKVTEAITRPLRIIH